MASRLRYIRGGRASIYGGFLHSDAYPSYNFSMAMVTTKTRRLTARMALAALLLAVGHPALAAFVTVDPMAADYCSTAGPRLAPALSESLPVPAADHGAGGHCPLCASHDQTPTAPPPASLPPLVAAAKACLPVTGIELGGPQPTPLDFQPRAPPFHS